MEETPKKQTPVDSSENIENLKQTPIQENIKKIFSLKKTISITIIILVLILSIYLLRYYHNQPEVSKELAKCIANNSILYVQLGCSHCETQEKMFGDNLQYINKIDCFYDEEKCAEKSITATPTWIINDKKYIGVKQIDELKKITKCE